jgi:hypothetical protein
MKIQLAWPDHNPTWHEYEVFIKTYGGEDKASALGPVRDYLDRNGFKSLSELQKRHHKITKE